MKIHDIRNKAILNLNRGKLTVQKHSPEILMVFGVVGFVATVVAACKATTKLNDITEKRKADIETIEKAAENGEVNGEKYSDEDKKKDIRIVNVKTGAKIVKLYAPAAAIGIVSIASICGSHYILQKRNLALTAAYAAIDKGYKEYRDRVVEKYGEEVDRELKHGIKKQEVEKTVKDDNGEDKQVKETIDVVEDPNGVGPYAKFFDEGSTAYVRDPESNLRFLRSQQTYLNQKLKSQGHLYLNEVYDALGLPRTRSGQQIGWWYDPDNLACHNYVDLGIYNVNRASSRDFVNGYNACILLYFNVDGNILEMMEEE